MVLQMLVIFQAMDAAGKDSTIRKVLLGVDPGGLAVHGFRQPSQEESEHDFLWRSYRCLPARGKIAVFNRSYYEDVIVTRVHPYYLDGKLARHTGAAHTAPLAPHRLWNDRFESIRNHELHLARSGTVVLKFMLHTSKEMQARRLLRRIELPEKNHKLSPSDLPEREHWELYQRAYQDAIRQTSRRWAPWYVVPADNKLYMQEQVASIIHATLAELEVARQPSRAAADETENRRLKDSRLKLVADLLRAGYSEQEMVLDHKREDPAMLQ